MTAATDVNAHELRPVEPCEPTRAAFRDPALRYQWIGGKPNGEGTAVGFGRVTRAILIKQHGHPPAVVHADVT